jgi:nitric oxide reductase NorD protein
MNSPLQSSEVPRPAAELEERLHELLDAVLSTRRTAAPLGASLCALSRTDQDFVLHWTGVIVRTSPEMGYQFALRVPGALACMAQADVEAWIIRAMDTYDRTGLNHGSSVLREFAAHAREHTAAASSVALSEITEVLAHFMTGLSARPIKILSADDTYTDTETLHLPPNIGFYADRERNFVVYKATCAHLWAQGRFGAFRAGEIERIAAMPDATRRLAQFHYLETVRLDACIARALPGLGRAMHRLREGTVDILTAAQRERLEQPRAGVADCLQVLAELPVTLTPPRFPYMGTLRPDAARAVRSENMKGERTALAAASTEELPQGPDAKTATVPNLPAPQRFTTKVQPDNDDKDHVALELDGQPPTASPDIEALLQSMAQDLGDIPDEYLVPAGDGSRRPAIADEADVAAAACNEGRQDEEAHLYDEWDFRRRHYRRQWCVLRESDVHPGDPAYVDAVLARHPAAVARLRRTFETMRGEDRLLKRQSHGVDIDIDAVVEGFADVRVGRELPERLHLHRQRTDRSIAVMFMVDMSGSTKGWINDAERESLVLLCEALEILGDRYAIYGFSGVTRKRCEVFRVKRFEQHYDEDVKSRIAGIAPQEYTRMGVAIRHLTGLLERVDARTKLLITLSDGKPDDYSDNYRGNYGVEDTRQALLEARRRGIHPFCITIDRDASEYLPRMYGAANFIVIDDVATLPLKVADIYRRLTR